MLNTLLNKTIQKNVDYLFNIFISLNYTRFMNKYMDLIKNNKFLLNTKFN